LARAVFEPPLTNLRFVSGPVLFTHTPKRTIHLFFQCTAAPKRTPLNKGLLNFVDFANSNVSRFCRVWESCGEHEVREGGTGPRLARVSSICEAVGAGERFLGASANSSSGLSIANLRFAYKTSGFVSARKRSVEVSLAFWLSEAENRPEEPSFATRVSLLVSRCNRVNKKARSVKKLWLMVEPCLLFSPHGESVASTRGANLRFACTAPLCSKPLANKSFAFVRLRRAGGCTAKLCKA
jgi:hypothetical protein